MGAVDSGAQTLSNGAETIEDFLFGLRNRGIKPGLEPTRAALRSLGRPDLSMRVIQVAGSVGKGSTAVMAESILRAAGLKTALFTSPHLVRFGERFAIGGEAASRETLETALAGLKEALPWAVTADEPPPVPEARPLTFFEWATVLACHLFEKAEVEAAVLEVGLGGRWDATTACKADVTAISRIDLEHTEILGETLEEIAFEKAGVMRSGVPAVTIAQAPEVLRVLRRRAEEVGTNLLIEGEDFFVEGMGEGIFSYQGQRIGLPKLEIGLVGRHQIENAGLAVAAIEALAGRVPRIADRALGSVPEGLKAALIAGRIEEIVPGLWIDGAHTRASIAALASEIARAFPGGRAHIVFAVLMEKPAEALLELLRPVAASLTLTSAGKDRAVSPEALLSMVSDWQVPVRLQPDPTRAVELAMQQSSGRPVVACGSLYLVGEIQAALEAVSPDPGDPSARDHRETDMA